ncbi:MAG: DUF1559 domain-containing protein [Opitutaceae bacterium]|jgi:prepilin-type N-terminal cleavage/methylation domain-containing protein|nr:DUF1559 domain-containing protein [Opitutaceae bacterium]
MKTIPAIHPAAPVRPVGSIRAFTLIELLTVIAIIGILSALALAGIGMARKKAQQVRCISNLRQMGVAILAYTDEHRGILPGPTGLNASPKYYSGKPESFGYKLAPWLAIRRPEDLGAEEGKASILLCPSRAETIPSYLVQCTLDKNRMSNESVRPFGQSGLADSDPRRKPVPYAELETIGGPSRVWALIEADQMLGNKTNPATGWTNATGVPGSGWYGNLPEQPIHGNARAVLYFDARVALIRDVPAPFY